MQNITDVGHLTDDGDQGEDKVEQRAKELGLEPMELVEDQLARYFRDTAALNIGRGYAEDVGGGDGETGAATGRQDIMPRATGHINEMITYVQRIIDNGYAYEVDGNIYFDVEAFAQDYPYGAMAKKDLDQLKAEAESRVEPDPNKKHQFDFALWLNAEDTGHLMTWDATFDVDGDRVDVTGYPGWHLECTVMSQQYLGDEFDIHAGGKDHIFPHHPNERAQALAATGAGQARYWLHNEFITVEGDKMAKSEGNFYTVRELIDEHGFSGDVIRWYLLSSHYRSETDFSVEGLEKAEKELQKVRKTVQRIRKTTNEEHPDIQDAVETLEENFKSAMDDDLNTPLAKNALMGNIRDVNRWLSDEEAVHDDVADTFEELFSVLGIDITPDVSSAEREMADVLLNLREEYRDREDYERADRIREVLEDNGFEVEDLKDGAVWGKTS